MKTLTNTVLWLSIGAMATLITLPDQVHGQQVQQVPSPNPSWWPNGHHQPISLNDWKPPRHTEWVSKKYPPNHLRSISSDNWNHPNPHDIHQSGNWPGNHHRHFTHSWPTPHPDPPYPPNHHENYSKTWPKPHARETSNNWPPSHNGTNSRNGDETPHYQVFSNTWNVPNPHNQAWSETWPPNHDRYFSRRNPTPPQHNKDYSLSFPPGHIQEISIITQPPSEDPPVEEPAGLPPIQVQKAGAISVPVPIPMP